MSIDGESVAGRREPDGRRSRHGGAFARVPDCTREQLDAAVAAAQRAFRTWSDKPLDERRRLVNAFIERVVADADTLAPLITREQGKPLAKARSEINSAVFFSRGYAAVDLPPEVLRDTPQQRVELRRRPLGRGRRDHRLELPGAAGDVEDRAGAAGRQHGRAQAVARTRRWPRCAWASWRRTSSRAAWSTSSRAATSWAPG